MNRALPLAAVMLAGFAVLSACSGGSEEAAESEDKSAADAASASPSAEPSPTPTVTPPEQLEPGHPRRTRPPEILGGEELPVLLDSPEERDDPEIDHRELDDILPPPGSGASMTEQVLHELQQETLFRLGTRAEVAPGACAAAIVAEIGWNTTCTSVLEGVEIEWDVEITAAPHIVTYTMDTDQAVLFAQDVYYEFWEFNYADEMRCDEIPRVVVVRVGEELPYRCQEVNYYPPESGPPRWVFSSISVDGFWLIEFDEEEEPVAAP